MRRLLGFATIAVFAACGDDGGATTDAAVMPDATPTFGTPTPVTLAPGVGVDDDPSFTDDLLDLYFNRDNDIYMAHRASMTAAFDMPVKVAEVSGASLETGPHISGDGLTIYFASNRNGANLDIFSATRASRSAPFDAPVAVDALSSNVDDAGPSATNDGLTAVVSSIRGGGNPDLFIATRASTSAAFDAPTAVAMANTPAGENSPMLSGDKLTLYWDANPTASGDLFYATRTSATGSFGAPMPITALNTTSEEGDLWVSPDGHHAIFVSNRDGSFKFYEATR